MTIPVGRRYQQMMAECRAIVASDLPDKAKEAACLSVLRDYVDRIALSRSGSREAQLQLYADMLVLRDQLFPLFTTDDLGRLAIWPMFRWVNGWLRTHATHRTAG
jgi:hypothetical protein